MLEAFLDLIEDSDILTGWNSEGYDMTYTVNRVSRVLSKDDTRRFCLWKQLPKKREFEKYGKKAEPMILVGRVHLDSLELSSNTHMKKDTLTGLMPLVKWKL